MLKCLQFIYGIDIGEVQHVPMAVKVCFNLSYLLYLSVLIDYRHLKAPNLYTGELICHHSRNAVGNNITTNVRRHFRNALTTAVVT